MKVESNVNGEMVEEKVKVGEKVAGSIKFSNVQVQEASCHRVTISVWDCDRDPGWFDPLKTLQFQFLCPILCRNADYVPKSAHKEYWE